MFILTIQTTRYLALPHSKLNTQAQHSLERSNWNLSEAVTEYFTTQEEDSIEETPDEVTSHYTATRVMLVMDMETMMITVMMKVDNPVISSPVVRSQAWLSRIHAEVTQETS